MSTEIKPQHAKLLAQIIEQSSHWKLKPEKKRPFHSVTDAFSYVEDHNEPLYLQVPIAGEDDHLLVKVTSKQDDMVFSTVSFETPAQTQVHHSHLKLIESSVTDMLNNCLSEGKKIASF